jgi:hypothetical protein
MLAYIDDKKFSNLQASLKSIYEVFSSYQKPPVDLTCLDYGPNKEEIEIFQKFELPGLPYNFISKLEFYDETWNSWGGCQEVKYFIPRLLEYMCVCWVDGHDRQGFFNKSINYKLSNLDNWTQKEQDAIKSFSKNLFLCFIQYGDVYFIDEVFDFIFSIKDDIEWYMNTLVGSPGEIKEKIFYGIFNNWLNADMHKNPTRYSINSTLAFQDLKRSLLDGILKNNNLIINLEFLYQEPWDGLILNGISPLLINVVQYLDNNKNDEFEYYIAINEQRIIVHSMHDVPYELIPGKSYPVEFFFLCDDDCLIEVSNEKKYGFEKTEGGYYLYGKLDDNKLNLNGLLLDNDLFSDCQYLHGMFVKVKINRIDIAFLKNRNIPL